jgi:hypothetical protein
MKPRQCSWFLFCLAAAALATGCQPSLKTPDYRSLLIDPTTLHFDLTAPIPIELDDHDRAKAALGEYYQIFVGQGGGTSIEHYRQPDSVSRRMRYGHFESGADHLLTKSSRSRAVLQGPFGTVYSDTTCFYNLPAAQYPSSVDVHAYANEFEHEAPAITAEPPSGISSDMTTFSLVRILRGDPEYLVLTATYSPRGGMTGFSIDGAKNGNWVHPNGVEGRAGWFTLPGGKPTEQQSVDLQRFGLPLSLPIDELVKTGRVALRPPGAVPVEREIFNVHYAYDRWIRQDDFASRDEHQRRYLTYLQTSEDAVLLPRCIARFPRY